jgi:lipopolysaccharide transport system permease protein
LIVLAALSLGIWFSAMVVSYRDFKYVVPFLVQIWMYLSPVIYPPLIVPERYRWLLDLNPMTGLIGGFRYAILGQALDWSALAVAVAMTVFGFVASVYYFRRVEARFADVI